MKKPNILYYSVLNYQPDNVAMLNEHFEVLELPDPSCDTNEALAQVEVILSPLGYFIGKEKIDAAPNLKIIGSNTTGHPHIDVDYAHEKGIKVVTLKNEHKFLKSITSTAELTWGLLLALTRNVIPAADSVKEGQWNRRLFGGDRMLSSLRLGIVGLGRLGTMVSRYARSFGMEVAFYDPYVYSRRPGLEKVDSLEELVQKSDVITVHVPHEKHTEGMFDEKIFEVFKQGSYFINTSRGELVDHAVLLECLNSGAIAGAALDVFEDEFKPSFNDTLTKHPLWSYAKSHNNLIITPHIGGSTYDAWSKTEEHTIDLILDALHGDPLKDDKYSVQKDVVWALIPARGGSKSIPLKNIFKLNGVPLIAYSFKAGKSSPLISRIVCSTDDDRIIDYCNENEVEVQRRPDSLAQDNVSTVDVILHFLEVVEKEEKTLPDYLVLLEPTSPFVQPEHIEKCIQALKDDERADSSQTVTMVASNSHAFNQRYHDENGSNFIFIEERESCFNKQLKPKFYIHGNVRVMKVESVIKHRSLFGERSIPIEIPRIFAMDVDGPDDFELAESMIKSGLI